MPGLAALLWIKLPGESDGKCGGETTYLFSPRQARRLTVNSPFVPIEDRRLADTAGVPAIADDGQEQVSAAANALQP
jgi:endoglucanase